MTSSKELVDYLKRCDDAYYNSSSPIVSDATYDAMIETLRRIDPTNTYLTSVGSVVRSNKIGRVIPMGTLSKYHKEDEISKWLESEKGEEFILSPKYDGFAVELVYNEGNLVSASTRGDGNVGEDILASVMRIKSIPIRLSKYLSKVTIIRGEAIIPLVNHEKIKELGYAAMRNAVPGIVRSNRVDALGYVDFVAYEFIDGKDSRISQRDYYKDDFIIEDYLYYPSPTASDLLPRREELRATEYKYELDGVVIKTEKIKDDDLLNPSHMIAWKYKSNRESTCLHDIEYSMGVSGYFTPIGIFDEVEFQGAKLTRASLGNITRMKKEFEGMTYDSIISVSRRGDIIPYIEELLYKGEGKEIKYPTHCPYCGEELSMDALEPHCINKSCPEKLRLQISQYAKSVGIKGIGDKLITGLIESGHIKSITDIYSINPEVILDIPRQGQSAVEKWKSLQEKKLSPLELLTCYPFLDLGKKLWEKVLAVFSFEDIVNINREELLAANLKGIGDIKIDSILSQVSLNREELNILGHIHL